MNDRTETACSRPECQRAHHARGLCQPHYNEARSADALPVRFRADGPGHRLYFSVPEDLHAALDAARLPRETLVSAIRRLLEKALASP